MGDGEKSQHASQKRELLGRLHKYSTLFISQRHKRGMKPKWTGWKHASKLRATQKKNVSVNHKRYNNDENQRNTSPQAFSHNTQTFTSCQECYKRPAANILCYYWLIVYSGKDLRSHKWWNTDSCSQSWYLWFVGFFIWQKIQKMFSLLH